MILSFEKETFAKDVNRRHLHENPQGYSTLTLDCENIDLIDRQRKL